MESTSTADDLVSALNHFYKEGESILHHAKSNAAKDIHQFLNFDIKGMFGLTGQYRKLFDKFNVKSKDEFERKILRKHFSKHAVQDVNEDVHVLERDWDNFLEGIDQQINSNENISEALAINDEGPVSLKLQDLESDDLVNVKDLLHGNTMFVLLRHFA